MGYEVRPKSGFPETSSLDPDVTSTCWIFSTDLKASNCWEAAQQCKRATGFFLETDLGRTMEGYGYEHFGADGAKESQQVDYRRIVGDTQPPRTSVSFREGEHYVRQTSHGHETAAQRYSATRIQAGLGPERWVAGEVYGQRATFRYNSSIAFKSKDICLFYYRHRLYQELVL